MLKILEQKNNTVAFGLIVIAAIFWGLFGIVSAVASDITTSPLLFTTVGTFFALLSSFLACFLLKIDIKEILMEIKNNNKLLKVVIIRTFAGFNSLILVVGFFLLSNKIIGLLISSSTPMLSVLLSYYVLKSELSHEKSISYSWFLIILAFIGVAILSLEAHTYAESAPTSNMELLGLGIVFIGLCASVIAKTLGPKITFLLQENNPKRTKIEYALGSQLISNFFLFLLMSLIALVFYTPTEIKTLISVDFLLLAIFFGIFIEFLPTAIGRLAGSLATSHNIFIAWFITPVVGVLLLWLFGYGEINTTIVLAFILILIPNILLNINITTSSPTSSPTSIPQSTPKKNGNK